MNEEYMPTDVFTNRLKLLDLTRQSYADICGVGIRTVFRWIKDNKVPVWNHHVLNALEYENRIE